jgi:DNA-binding LytR/AlgR family response regulator
MPHLCDIETAIVNIQTYLLMAHAISLFPALPQDAPEAALGSTRTFAVKMDLPDTAPVPRGKHGKKIALPTMEGLCFEKVKDIAYLEASGNYTVLHFLDKRQTLVCKTLREIECMLPEKGFARIHRSHTIHVRHLKKYVRGKGGHVILENGTTLPVSAGQKDAFMEALKAYY